MDFLVIVLALLFATSLVGSFFIYRRSVLLEQKNLSEKLTLEKQVSLLESEKHQWGQFAAQRECDLKEQFRVREASLIEQFESREKENRSFLGTQFENLATKIVEEKTKVFSSHSEKNIQVLLNPLREQLTGFQKKVEEVYQHEARERHSLKGEINRLLDANTKISEDAKHLTQALTGQSKTQGDWGEIQLQRLLESAGLMQGSNFDFVTQAREMGLKQDEGGAAKPDVVVFLPEKKHLVIDSKVSLTHYYKFTKSESEEDKKSALKAHLDSVYSHIEGLSAKAYESLEGLRSPEFVLLFMPTEGALTLAIHSDPELFSWAWKRNIILVGPTNLFAVLKTVSSIWTRDKQSQNALEIARQSGMLLDKLYGFVEDMEKVGESLARADKNYQGAMSKLKTGRGNILSKAETIKGLGARTSKELPERILSQVEREGEGVKNTALDEIQDSNQTGDSSELSPA